MPVVRISNSYYRVIFFEAIKCYFFSGKDIERAEVRLNANEREKVTRQLGQFSLGLKVDTRVTQKGTTRIRNFLGEKED